MRLVAASCVVSLALSLPRPFPRLRRPRCAPLTLEATEGAADAMSDAALRDLVARAWGGSTNRSVLPAWSGQNLWLWAQWRGTVLSHCLERALLTAAGGAVVLWSAKGGVRGGLPDPSHPVVARLAAVDAMWGHHLTLTTFVATFFLSHGYAFWRQMYVVARTIQGRLNDLGLLLAAHARAGDAAAAAAVAECARLARLSHLFFWAAVVRAAPSDDFPTSLNALLSARGLAALEAAGALAPGERSALLGPAAPPRDAWYLAALGRLAAAVADGVAGDQFRGGAGFESEALKAVVELRQNMLSVPDELAARMPLAYVHFVQCLVDLLCATAPLALFPRGGAFGIALCAVIALFFGGVVELSKAFLDPFGNRHVSNDSFRADVQVDVLLAESNRGLAAWHAHVDLLPRAASASD